MGPGTKNRLVLENIMYLLDRRSKNFIGNAHIPRDSSQSIINVPGNRSFCPYGQRGEVVMKFVGSRQFPTISWETDVEPT